MSAVTTGDQRAENEAKQPHTDFEIAKMCQWLKARGLTMHVKLDGSVTFRDKITGTIVRI
jgi:hypothetical protein